MTKARGRRQRRASIAELTSEQRVQLLHGRPLFDWDHPLTTDEMRLAWEQHRDDLKAEWAAKHSPGTRCFCEWLFDIVPRFGERPTTPYFNEYHVHQREAFLRNGLLHTCTSPLMQEEEHEYLFRNKLIDAAEYRAAGGKVI